MQTRAGILLALLACSCAHERWAPPEEPCAPSATTEITSAQVSASAPRLMQSKTIGVDHTTVTAPRPSPTAEPAEPQPAGPAARQAGQFYPPTMPVMGVMNPSPPDS